MVRRAAFIICTLGILITCSPYANAVGVQDIVNQVSQTNYRYYLDNLLFTHAGNNRGWSRQHDMARSNIWSKFASFGLTTSLDSFVCDHYGTPTTCYNVVGVHPGTSRPEDIFVIGAHYDSVGNPGADDNASGVAGVLEAARILSQYSFESTLVFVAFDREEDGLVGSSAYVNKRKDDNILGMLSLDMIAYNAGGSANNKALIYGRSISDPWKQSVSNAMSLYGSGLSATLDAELDVSDHAPFEWAGFQACLLIEAGVWSNPNYHKSTDYVDMPNYIDYTYATNMTCSAVGCLATAAHLAPVPEPGSLLVVSSGFGWIIIILRRRKTKHR